VRPDRCTDEVFERLLRRSDAEWEDFSQRRPAFQRFIQADLRLAREALIEARDAAGGLGLRFVELGSGVGSIAILADLLGFDSHGIEVDRELFETSLALAEEFDSKVELVEGSFVPPEFMDSVEHFDDEFPTPIDGADAFAELGLQLEDFDLIYLYPWPGEEEWYAELLERFAGAQAKQLTYSHKDGFRRLPVR
jgi:SAM-dependent methyltransferase